MLTAMTTYTDAQAHASGDALWALFDGDREALNIAHECITRHADGSGRAAARAMAGALERGSIIRYTE